MELDMIFAIIGAALGGLSFLASFFAIFAKKEKWFRLFVSLGGYWTALGVLYLIMAVRK